MFSDVNECRVDHGGCEQDCINTVGSYECQCKQGYILAEDAHSCMDINECEEDDDSCSGEASCVNTIGGYYCIEGVESEGRCK